MFGQANEEKTPPAPVRHLAQLEAQVQCRMSGRVRNLHLLVQDQGVVLRGHAATYYAKQLVQHAVMEAMELPILANEIEVI